MINMLAENESTVNAIKASINKEIKNIKISDNSLSLTFTDNSLLSLWDNGQSCCESRYMRTDDEFAGFIGAKLLGFELKDAPSQDADGDSHDVQFLEVTTDKGCFTVSNHNEHNGYYGGFSISARLSL